MISVMKNAFYAQSGGVTSVINSSAYGVISELQARDASINIFASGKVEINMAFSEDYITNFHMINDYIKDIEKFIEYINNFIIFFL